MGQFECAKDILMKMVAVKLTVGAWPDYPSELFTICCASLTMVLRCASSRKLSA